jgi:hypothetical protein
MRSGETPGERSGGTSQGGPVDVRQLRREIQRTAKNISYDLERLERVASAHSQQQQQQQQQSAQQGQGSSSGSGPGRDGQESSGPGQSEAEGRQGRQGQEGQDEGERLSGKPGENEGQKAGKQTGGVGPGAPSSGRKFGNQGGKGSQTGKDDTLGGHEGGSQPGPGLYSNKEEYVDTGAGSGETFDLRVRGDNMGVSESRDVESSGTEVIESTDILKKYAPTVGVDTEASLSGEQAKDDAITKTHIPVEYESIIKNIYIDKE